MFRMSVRAALPTRNFVRHPITYTSLISEYVADKGCFPRNKFLKDIDFAFLPVVSNETDQTLARFAYKPATANIQYAPKFREARVRGGFFTRLKKYETDCCLCMKEMPPNLRMHF